MAETIKVMTFNVRIDNDEDPYKWSERKKWIAQIIETYSPDVIGTQEVMPHMLEDLTGYLSDTYLVYGEPRSEGADTEIAAIFARKEKFIFKEEASFMVSETPDVWSSKGWDGALARICSWVELVDKETEDSLFRFFNTHLDHRGEIARKEGCKTIIQQINRLSQENPLPFVLTGDFNAKPEMNLISPLLEDETLSNSYKDLLNAEESTHLSTFNRYIGFTEGTPIDYIFASRPLLLQNTQIIRDTVDNGYPSDHYPVMSEVVLNKEREKE